MIKLYCQYCGRYCAQKPDEINFRIAPGADVDIVATCADCIPPKQGQSNPFDKQHSDFGGKDIMDFLMGFKK